MKRILNNENIIVRELNKQQDKQTISTTILNAWGKDNPCLIMIQHIG